MPIECITYTRGGLALNYTRTINEQASDAIGDSSAYMIDALPPGNHNVTPREFTQRAYDYWVHVYDNGMGMFVMVPRSNESVFKEINEETFTTGRGLQELGPGRPWIYIAGQDRNDPDLLILYKVIIWTEY